MSKRSEYREVGISEAEQLILEIGGIPEADISSLLDGVALLGRFDEELAAVESLIGHSGTS